MFTLNILFYCKLLLQPIIRSIFATKSLKTSKVSIKKCWDPRGLLWRSAWQKQPETKGGKTACLDIVARQGLEKNSQPTCTVPSCRLYVFLCKIKLHLTKIGTESITSASSTDTCSTEESRGLWLPEACIWQAPGIPASPLKPEKL